MTYDASQLDGLHTAANGDPQQPSVEPPQAKPGKAKRPQPDGRSRSNLRHGLRCSQLPKGCGYVRKAVHTLRIRLEDAVVDRKGSVSFVDACTINTACRWEQHSLLSSKWLKDEAAKLTADQRMRFANEAITASEKRDRLVARLLGEPSSASASPYASLYGDPGQGDEPAQDRTPRVQGDDLAGGHG